ncbi:MAG: DNA repair and recombination protein RadB [Methanobrevibacter sp.]|jgi:DNA repair protein RadB|nr:DNA repair and recombination protein RadB [Candidatus Methanovirga australis]
MKVLKNIEQTKIATNSSLDKILGGGIEKGNITQFYGPPGSGKTNISLLSAVQVVKNGKKVIYIDTEGGISIDRIKQIAKDDFEDVVNNIIVFEPHSFQEQENDLKTIGSLLSSKGDEFDLIVLDSAVALYRLNESKSPILNKELGKQMGLLSTFSRKHDLSVLITNQIYSAFDGESNENIRPVGGDILRYWSKAIVELEKSDLAGQRIANLRRHRSMSEGLSVKFKIINSGIC